MHYGVREDDHLIDYDEVALPKVDLPDRWSVHRPTKSRVVPVDSVGAHQRLVDRSVVGPLASNPIRGRLLFRGHTG